MSSSTPTQETAARTPAREHEVGMRELLAAGAAAAAVCTPPSRPAQAITVTRVPVGAKSQSV
ncbi:hypothetical protein P3T36_005867 [Kitasatospora sp. MAP12-15]|uniref:hypothetical protein n=1 Tax=unclassified Kitasatospora TaxID=2633591 RepID=UPI00247401E7|nr:hypothetical protein [Kitasatospora sp. MAP12-44]MDH6110963.1 hypothetical protein [Kitasatospora sp. MAP12-44]